MKESKDRVYRIGPAWDDLVVALLMIPIVIYFLHKTPNPNESIVAKRFFPVMIIAIPLMLLEALKTTHVSKLGIQRKWCGIPYRFVAWEQIDQIGRMPNGRLYVVMITLKGTKRFCPEHSRMGSVNFYIIRHPTGVLAIYGKKNEAAVIEKCYGALDYDFLTK